MGRTPTGRIPRATGRPVGTCAWCGTQVYRPTRCDSAAQRRLPRCPACKSLDIDWAVVPTRAPHQPTQQAGLLALSLLGGIIRR